MINYIILKKWKIRDTEQELLMIQSLSLNINYSNATTDLSDVFPGPNLQCETQPPLH